MWKLENISGTEVVNFNNDLKDIIMYPNPFSYETILKLTNSMDRIENLILYNTMGEMVKEISKISNTQITIQKEDLSKGMYFFKLTTENKNTVFGKFILQ